MGLLGPISMSHRRSRKGREKRKRRRKGGCAGDKDDDDDSDDDDGEQRLDVVGLSVEATKVRTPWDSLGLTVAGFTDTTTESVIAQAGRTQRDFLLSQFVDDEMDIVMRTYEEEIALMRAEEAANGMHDGALEGVDTEENWVVYRSVFDDDDDPADRRDAEISDAYAVLDLMLRLLDEIPRRFGMTTADRRPYHRTVAQVEFHRHFLCADLGNIFHTHLASQIPTIKSRYGLQPSVRNVAVGAPRRLGKTFAVANYVAAAHLAIPGDTTTVFSPAERVSKWFKETVMDMMGPMMVNFPQSAPQITNTERCITHFSHDDKRHLKCLPCSESGTRGVDGSRVIAEEAAMLPPTMIGAVLTPLLAKANVSFMAISSVKSDTNAFSKLMNLPSFSRLLIEMVCSRHAAEGVTDVCPCNAALRPAHLPIHQMAAIRDILDALDMRDDYEREIIGRVTGNTNAAFIAEHVNALFDRAPYSPSTSTVNPGYVFIITDPNGGGASDYACITLYLSHTGKIVVRVCVCASFFWRGLQNSNVHAWYTRGVLGHEVHDDGHHKRHRGRVHNGRRVAAAAFFVVSSTALLPRRPCVRRCVFAEQPWEPGHRSVPRGVDCTEAPFQEPVPELGRRPTGCPPPLHNGVGEHPVLPRFCVHPLDHGADGRLPRHLAKDDKQHRFGGVAVEHRSGHHVDAAGLAFCAVDAGNGHRRHPGKHGAEFRHVALHEYPCPERDRRRRPTGRHIALGTRPTRRADCPTSSGVQGHHPQHRRGPTSGIGVF